MIVLRGSQLTDYFTPFRCFTGKEQGILDLWLKHYEELGIRVKVVVRDDVKVLMVHVDDHEVELERELFL